MTTPPVVRVQIELPGQPPATREFAFTPGSPLLAEIERLVRTAPTNWLGDKLGRLLAHG